MGEDAKTHKARPVRWVVEPPPTEAVGRARPAPLFFAVSDIKGRKLYGMLLGEGRALDADQPTAEEIELLEALGRRDLRADPPWRAVKSDLNVEDYSYPGDEGRPIGGEVGSDQPPSKAPFAFEQTGLAVHAETHLTTYALLSCMQAAVPATAGMTLKTLSQRLNAVTALVTDNDPESVRISPPQGELGAWFEVVKEQIEALRVER